MPADAFQPKKMPFDKYQAFRPLPLDLPGRAWPSRQIEKAPVWCSVDLRDGNQALVEPMDPERKLAMFEALVRMGFKEIEVGFPSASQTDYDFLRLLIDKDLIPIDVTIQVLVQARADLIKRTYECLRDAHSAVVHFYNSTSVLQRRVVFRTGREGVTKLAVDAAKLCRGLEADFLDGTAVRYEYSPESFTGTEVDFAVEICAAVMEEVQPTPASPLILNLPSTVEMYTPNVYADTVEAFIAGIPQRESVIVSLHPHNDRGTAVAAAELGVMDGADRVEGTLFGNGERTGNVDLVTLALNLFSQGVDPRLDLSDVDALRRMAEHCTRIPVHPRHPYVGDLVYTAFSGSHQDAIKKGMEALDRPYERWEVPYLPIDPVHVGRSYEAVIRVNSQSGKGGVAYILKEEHGLNLPRKLQIEFSKVVQQMAERTGSEVTPAQIWQAFEAEYLPANAPVKLTSHETTTTGQKTTTVVELSVGGEARTLRGRGGGPISALVHALTSELGVQLEVADYQEHAIGEGTDTIAVAYVEAVSAAGPRWGVGIDESILTASFKAVLSALNRFERTAEETTTGRSAG